MAAAEPLSGRNFFRLAPPETADRTPEEDDWFLLCSGGLRTTGPSGIAVGNGERAPWTSRASCESEWRPWSMGTEFQSLGIFAYSRAGRERGHDMYTMEDARSYQTKRPKCAARSEHGATWANDGRNGPATRIRDREWRSRSPAFILLLHSKIQLHLDFVKINLLVPSIDREIIIQTNNIKIILVELL